jgi:hypothetical protein
MSLFAKSLIKYGEEELRQRCETQALREHQYHHLLYIKEMESVYYRQKCEQFITNIDTIINAKMSSQGNQMIYELDISQRELRTLKDHYYEMESCLRTEIRSEFTKSLNDQNTMITKQKGDFGAFRNETTKELIEEVANELQTLEEKVKRTATMRSLNQNARLVSAEDEAYVSNKKSDMNPELLGEIVGLTQYIRKMKTIYHMKVVLS